MKKVLFPNNNRSLTTFLFLCITVAACSSTRSFRKSDLFIEKEVYMKSYRTALICGCINEGTNNGLNKMIKEVQDPGLFTEKDIIGWFTVQEADSIGRSYAKKIPAMNYSDANFKKPIVSRCMWYGMGKEVEKMVAEKYKVMSRSKEWRKGLIVVDEN